MGRPRPCSPWTPRRGKRSTARPIHRSLSELTTTTVIIKWGRKSGRWPWSTMTGASSSCRRWTWPTEPALPAGSPWSLGWTTHRPSSGLERIKGCLRLMDWCIWGFWRTRWWGGGTVRRTSGVYTVIEQVEGEFYTRRACHSKSSQNRIWVLLRSSLLWRLMVSHSPPGSSRWSLRMTTGGTREWGSSRKKFWKALIYFNISISHCLAKDRNIILIDGI